MKKELSICVRIIVAILFLNTSSNAQGYDDKKVFVANDWHYKINALSFLEPITPSFNLAVERRINKIVSAQLQAGYIFTSMLMINADSYTPGMRTNGVIVRPELRFKLSNESTSFSRSFLAFDYNYKRLVMDRSGEVGFECETFGCLYFMDMDYQVMRTISGPNVKLGFSDYFDKELKGVFWEFALGVGARYYRADKPNLPANSVSFSRTDFTDLDLFPEQGALISPNIILEFFLGF